MKTEDIIKDSAQIPLGILHTVINANIIHHPKLRYYELDLSVFLRHYRAYLSYEEIKEAKILQEVLRSKWIDCVARFHEDIKVIRGKKSEIK